MEFTKPDWGFWVELGWVEAWQAVLLSLDVEPDSFQFEPQTLSVTPALPSSVGNSFNKRVRLLEPSVISDFKTRGIRVGGGSLTAQISIANFAGWAISRAWDVPQNLSAIAIPFKHWHDVVLSRAVEEPEAHDVSEQESLIAAGADVTDPEDLPEPDELNTPIATGSERPKIIWDEFENRRLLHKAQTMTHQEIADELGISRQAVSKQIGKAKDMLGVKKAKGFDGTGWRK